MSNESHKTQQGPFRGALPFTEADASVFMGREREVSKLLDRVSKANFRFGILTGEPGVGKTSLLRAGLVHGMVDRGKPAAFPLYVDCALGLQESLAAGLAELETKAPDAKSDVLVRLSKLPRALGRQVLVLLDHVEDVVINSDARDRALLQKLTRASTQASAPPLLVTVSSHTLPVVMELAAFLGLSIPPGMVFVLKRFDKSSCSALLEQSALASNQHFEAGLPEIMAQDLSVESNILPLTMQLAVAGAVAARKLASNDYLAAGASNHLIPAYVEKRASQAGKSGVDVLSYLADRREAGTGWVSLERIAREAGSSKQDTEAIVTSFIQAGLADRKGDDYRLSGRSLIPTIRCVDGPIRARRIQAAILVKGRVASERPLLLHHLWQARSYRPATDAERALLRKSKVLWGSAAGGLLLVVVGLFVWVQIAANSARQWALAGPGPAQQTIVIRRAKSVASHLALLPIRPAPGSLIEDTGIPATGLTARWSKALAHEGRDLQGGSHSGVPSWFSQLVQMTSPSRRGELLVLTGETKRGWKALTALSEGKGLARAIEFVRLVGTGEPDEIAMVNKARKSRRLELRALRAAFWIAMRNPSKAAQFLDPKAHWADALEQDMTTLPASVFLSNAALARVLSRKKAARLLPDVLAGRAKKLPLPIVARALAVHDLWTSTACEVLLSLYGQKAAGPVLSALVASGAPVDASAAFLRIVKRLADKPKGVTVQPIVTAIGRVGLSEARAAARTALRFGLGAALASKMTGLATSKDAAIRRKAAAVLAELSGSVATDANLLNTLLKDPEAEVRAEAVRWLGRQPKPSGATLLRATSDRSVTVRAQAMAAFARARRNDVDPYKIAKFLFGVAKSGPGGMRGDLARAAALLVNDTRQWDVAQNFVLTATRNPSAQERAKTAVALPMLAKVRSDVAMRVWNRLVGDSNPQVRLAALRAAPLFDKTLWPQTASALLKLATDKDHRVAEAALSLFVSPSWQKAAGANLRAALVAALSATSSPGLVARATALLAAIQPPSTGSDANMNQVLSKVLANVSDETTRMAIIRTAHSLALPSVLLTAAKLDDQRVATQSLHVLCRAGGATITNAISALMDNRKLETAAIACLLRGPAWDDPGLAKKLERRIDLLTKRGRLALSALARCKTKYEVVGRTLSKAAADPRFNLRMAAAEAAAQNPERYQTILSRLLHDSSTEVRRRVTVGVARAWAAKWSATKLAHIMDHSLADRHRRLAAPLALWFQMNGDNAKRRKDALAALEKARRSNRPITRILAGAALLSAPPKGPVQPLVDLIAHEFLF